MPRQKQPTALRVLHGETRPSRIGRGEPVPRAAPPEPPEWFDRRHRDVWDGTCREIEHMLGSLYAADTQILVAYVCAVVRHEVAARDIMARG